MDLFEVLRASSPRREDALAGERSRHWTAFLLASLVTALCARGAHGNPGEASPPSPLPVDSQLAVLNPELEFSLDLSDTALPALLPDENGEQADAAAETPVTEEGWTFRVAPFVWALALDGDVTAKGRTVNVDMSFSDIFDDLDFAGMLQLRARKDRFVLQLNGLYAKLSIDGAADYSGVEVPVGAAAEVNVDFELSIVELFAGYELFSYPLENGAHNPHTKRGASLILTPYGGVRYNRLKIDTSVGFTAVVGAETVTRSFDFNGSDGWFDPVIGLDLAVTDLGRWNIGLRGDIGGFGIGGASELVWSVGGRVRYQIKPRFQVWAGYYLLDYDYSTGSGSSQFGLDARLQGPAIGGSITF